MESFDIHLVQPNDKDYPTLMMKLVPNAEHYQLISMDGLILVPLNQVFDALSEIKADSIIRNGVECCPKCFKPLGEKGTE